MRKSIGSFFWSGVEKFGVVGCSFFSNIILARLLTPYDFGCIGMLAIFMAIAEAFVDGGFGSALIQKKNAGIEDFSTIFIWNLVVSICLYALLFVFSPAVACFYRLPQLSAMLRAEGIVLIINALSLAHLVKLRKEMRFKRICVITIGAVFVSVSVAILLASRGYGVWALVWQQIAMSITMALLSWLSCKLSLRLIFSRKSFSELFEFGVYIFLSNLLTRIGNNLQGLLIGRWFTPQILGYYSQASKLRKVTALTGASVIGQVSYSIFSECQDDETHLLHSLRRLLRGLSILTLPTIAVLMVLARPIILFLFGDCWLPAVPYFKILSIGGMAMCLQDLNYSAVAALGESKLIFKWTLIKRIVGIGLLLLGVRWGIYGILWASVAVSIFAYIVNAVLAAKVVGYKLLNQFVDLIPAAMLAGFILSIGAMH